MAGLFDNFRKNSSETTTALGQVAEKFAANGCQSINNAADQKALQTFQELPAAIQVKVPGAGVLNTAAQTCKFEV